jgi:hypothetical protein
MCDEWRLVGIQAMKDSIKKFFNVGSVVIIACFVAYGLAFAQQVCCSDIANECIPVLNPGSASNSFSDACKPSAIRHFSNKASTGGCKGELGETETCCKTDYCGSFGQAVYITPSFSYDITALQNVFAFINSSFNNPILHNSPHLSIRPISEPIYILTQSILC